MTENIREDEKKVFETYEKLAPAIIGQGYRHNPIYLARKAVVDWYLLSLAGLKDKSVLNIGCFEPIDEIVWAHYVKEWVAIDRSPTSINVARSIVQDQLPHHLAKKVHLEVMDAQKLDFQSGKFDIAVSFSVLDHIPDPVVRKKAISEMARVVRPGGHVVITVPNRYGYYRILYARNVRKGIETDVGYQYFFSPPELRSALRANKLQPLKFTSDLKNVGDLPKWLRGILSPLVFFGDRMGFLAQKTP